MANQKISARSLKASVTGTEPIPVGEATDPAITPNLIKTYFGTWSDWTITHGGFSAAPTYVARYLVIGKLFIGVYSCSASGTSNATSYTITLPSGLTAKTGHSQHGTLTSIIDNNTGLTPAGRFFTTSGSATITFNTNGAGAAWTASSSKRANTIITIELD